MSCLLRAVALVVVPDDSLFFFFLVAFSSFWLSLFLPFLFFVMPCLLLC